MATGGSIRRIVGAQAAPAHSPIYARAQGARPSETTARNGEAPLRLLLFHTQAKRQPRQPPPIVYARKAPRRKIDRRGDLTSALGWGLGSALI
jgi:hypothetical protein